MARKIVQAMVGIIVLLVILTAYFIQADNSKMVFLCTKMAVSIFVVFLFVSLVFCVAEENKLSGIWKIVAIVGGFAIAYPLFLAIGYIPVIINDVKRWDGNFGIVSGSALTIVILAALIFWLQKRREI